MDAVEFLKAKNRMCREYGELPEDCFACPIGNDSGGCQAGVLENQKVTEEMLVQIVEKWAKEHPKKTRQSEFLKMFPNARITIGDTSIGINPCYIDATYTPREDGCTNDCNDCRKEYWSQEVDDDE